MNPCELNAIISSLTNILYISLPQNEFRTLNILLSEIGKSMFSMELLRGVCEREKAQQADRIQKNF